LRVAILSWLGRGYGSDYYFPELVQNLSATPEDLEFVIVTSDARLLLAYASSARIRFASYPWLGEGSGVRRVLREQLMLPRVLRELRADVIFTANNTGILAAPCPCVIAVQNMEPLAAPFGSLVPRLLSRQLMLRTMTLVSLRRAARVVAVSGYVRDVLVRRGVPEGKVDLVYNGVRTDGPADAVEEGDWLASSSKFVRYANLITLVDGFAELCRRGYSGPLRFAGGPYDRRYERAVRRRIADHGLENRVSLLGYIARPQVRRLMRTAKAFVFASRVEACPFTVLEALSEGAAIVTSSAGPMPELCADAAMYFDPSDAYGLADAVKRVLTDADLRTALRQRARARAGVFNWGDVVARLAACFRRAGGGAQAMREGRQVVG
jgi:glycosyltransferase involved in cell wall biosynthesis